MSTGADGPGPTDSGVDTGKGNASEEHPVGFLGCVAVDLLAATADVDRQGCQHERIARRVLAVDLLSGGHRPGDADRFPGSAERLEAGNADRVEGHSPACSQVEDYPPAGELGDGHHG